MLNIKTYIDKSTIPGAGLGCFAGEDIKEGTLIWEFNPLMDRIYTKACLSKMSELEIDFINTYAYSHNGLYILCIDNGRFFNHSEEPNTLDPADQYCSYAKRDIKKGEEILSNYYTFGLTKEDRIFNSAISNHINE